MVENPLRRIPPLSRVIERRALEQEMDALEKLNRICRNVYPLLQEYGYTLSSDMDRAPSVNTTFLFLRDKQKAPLAIVWRETFGLLGEGLNRTEFKAWDPNSMSKPGVLTVQDMWADSNPEEQGVKEIYTETQFDRLPITRGAKLIKRFLDVSVDREKTIEAFKDKAKNLGGVEIFQDNVLKRLRWAKDVHLPRRPINI